MPVAIALLLYAIATFALVAGGGAGLMALVEPADHGMARIVAAGSASASVPAAAPDSVDLMSETPPEPDEARPPAWIVPTPRYDMPAPQVAKRDVENAKKMAGDRKRKARAAKSRRDHIPDLGADARSAYGYAGPPRAGFERDLRAVFGREMP